MKVNEAPEKIYVITYGSDGSELTYNWYNERLAVNDIEYTRTDAFIEKVDEFISTFFHPDDTELRNCLLKKFHEYIEGE